ncbi:hypothetical protein B296_00054647, partial [Ensete ventricosum]
GRSRPCPQALPLQATAPASDADLPCGLALAIAGRPLARGLARGLAVGGQPCMGAGRGWSPLLTVFAVKTTRRMILYDSILSHVVQNRYFARKP